MITNKNVEDFVYSKKLGLNWCKIVDAFQTSALEAENNSQLKYLAKEFGLAADLLL